MATWLWALDPLVLRKPQMWWTQDERCADAEWAAKAPRPYSYKEQSYISHIYILSIYYVHVLLNCGAY